MNRIVGRRREMFLPGEKEPLFAGLMITPAPASYRSRKWTIVDNDWNHDSYNQLKGSVEGSYYISTRDYNLNNLSFEYNGYSDWRIPTQRDFENILNGNQRGSKINGVSGCRFAVIRLVNVPHASIANPYGLLLAPDRFSISGMSRTFIWNVSYSSTSNGNVTEAQLNEYLSWGCAFLPVSGYYRGRTSVWGNGSGMYPAQTKKDSQNLYCLSISTGVSVGYITISDNYHLPIRCVRTA